MPTGGDQPVYDLLESQLHELREFMDLRRSPGLIGELTSGLVHSERALLGSARHVHRPPGVPKEATKLTQDRRHRIRGKRRAALRNITINRLDQAHIGDLDKILRRLISGPIPDCEPASKQRMPPNQLVPRPAALVPKRPQLTLLTSRPTRRPQAPFAN